MGDAFDAGQLAKRIVAAHRGGALLEVETIGGLPQSFADAFAVQSQVMAELGAVGAYKTSNAAPGDPVVLAPIPADYVRPSPARYEAGEMRRVGIELEIAFQIDRPLPEVNASNFEEALRASVSVVPVIEMVDTRLADVDGAPPLLKMADNQSGFGLVVGMPVVDWDGLDLSQPAITFTVDGEQVGTTNGQVPGGDAFSAFAGLVRAIGDHCGGLAVGQVVTTGSLSGLHWIERGVEVKGSIAGLGSVTVTVEA